MGFDFCYAFEGAGCGVLGLDDSMLDDIRAQFAKFADVPRPFLARKTSTAKTRDPDGHPKQDERARRVWSHHPRGGLGLSKVAMCVVTEELSRGYIGKWVHSQMRRDCSS